MELFADHGAHILVDGQFGSTGKGALAAWLAHKSQEKPYRDIDITLAITSGGPNSGHTFYNSNGEKRVLKQLPVFACALHEMGVYGQAYLSAGAIIDPEVLIAEAKTYPYLEILVHPNAAVVIPEDVTTELSGSIARVAGTRSGTGAALMRKIAREHRAVWSNYDAPVPANIFTGILPLDYLDHRAAFVEVSQGFSLGINSQFYPKVTSRECTAMQAMADARIAPRRVAKTYMSMRTFPIRVGNVDGYSSGGWYPDQRELQWADLGQVPELTTVTQRERRIATFSWVQFEEALWANDPEFVFFNFMNYLQGDEHGKFIEKIKYFKENRSGSFDSIWGYGPRVEDIRF